MAQSVSPTDQKLAEALQTKGEPRLLTRMGRGIEKESLRVTPEGSLSKKTHPVQIGSALTHPQITTDFSESQLELIAGVHTTPQACIDELEDIHRFVYQNIGDELLWPASMPCILADDDIPVGQYGTSNIARAKTIYRQGLSNRYGSLMQTISGIHYNFSMPDEFWPILANHLHVDDNKHLRTHAYFNLIRNFRRYSWLLIYLFGASPAVCKSFLRGSEHNLVSLDEGTYYLPHATCLRMGNLGYQSDAQSGLHISYNTLEEYSATMRYALTQPYPEYEKFGVKHGVEYKQLNTSLIQIENEFYGTIRPKQPVASGERPLTALHNRGVQYVEVRCLDLNPFLRVGIDVHEIRFLDTFLLYCLLAPSPKDTPEESQAIAENQAKIVSEGRKPGLQLESAQGVISRDKWAQQLLDECQSLAAQLDQAHTSDTYSYALEQQRDKVKNPELTPSARTLQTMQNQRIPFFRYVMNQAVAHKGFFINNPLRATQLAGFDQSAKDSLLRQQEMEAATTEPFADFLERYLAIPEH